MPNNKETRGSGGRTNPKPLTRPIGDSSGGRSNPNPLPPPSPSTGKK